MATEIERMGERLNTLEGKQAEQPMPMTEKPASVKKGMNDMKDRDYAHDCEDRYDDCGDYGYHGHHDHCYTTHYESDLLRQLGCKDARLSEERAKKFAMREVDCATRPLERQICDLKACLMREIGERERGDDVEREKRKCGDERLFDYMNAHYIRAEKRLDSRDIDYGGVRPVLDCGCRNRRAGRRGGRDDNDVNGGGEEQE